MAMEFNILFMSSILDLLKSVMSPFKSILSEIHVWTTNHSWMIRDKINLTTITPTFPLCQTLDLHDYFNLKDRTPLVIWLALNQTESVGVSFRIEDRLKRVKRAIMSQLKSYSGPVLSIKDLGVPRQIESLVVLSQTKFSEKDEENQCRNYPYANYQGFEDCDFDWVQKELSKLSSVVPFWASRNMEAVTKFRYCETRQFLLLKCYNYLSFIDV